MAKINNVLMVLLLIAGAYGAWAWAWGGDIEHRFERSSAALPEQVMRYLTEPERRQQWFNGLVDNKPLGDPGTYVGARSIDVIENNGRRDDALLTVTEYTPGKLLAITHTGEFFNSDGRYELVADQNGTQLTYVTTTYLQGVLRLAGPFFAPVLEKEHAANLDRLIETIATGGAR